MNTSRNNRSLRKKAIPLYFQKSHSSRSDILKTASYKRHIKDLVKLNKTLAVSLQDAKYRAANQQKEIEEYARTTTQVSHAQLKLKDMASTIQKLVCDLEEVRGFLDVNSFNLMKNVDSSDHRLRIQVPDHSTIEESASMSILEADLSSAEGVAGSSSPSTVMDANSTIVKDDSFTEIYDHNIALARVDSVLKGCLIKSQEDKNVKNQIMDNSASISVQSQPKPQLEISKNKLPGKLEAFLQNYKESARKPLQALNTIPLVKNTTNTFVSKIPNSANTFVSKIPKVSKIQPPHQQDENLQPIELPTNSSHRRETFVVKKPCSIPEVFISAADRRGTFVINNLSEDSKCQNDRRGTYLVPPEIVPPIQGQSESPPIQEQSVLPIQEPVPTNDFAQTVFCTENAIPNKTILLCEDMELTEIIPTHKPWNEPTEVANNIPDEKNKETASPLADEDVEFTQIVPVLELPFQKPHLQAKVIDTGKVVVDKKPSSKENVPTIGSPLEDDCFVKPSTPKSSKSSSSNNSASSEQKRIHSTACKSDAIDDQLAPSRKSSAKRKKSHDIELPDLAIKDTLKGRASSTSKRKSVACKGNGKLSDVKSRRTSRKSVAKTSFKKPMVQMDSEVDFCSDIEDELPSDISLTSSSSPSKRRTRKKSSFNYETFFADTSLTSDPEPVHKNAPLGRRVINFFETRQSLLPNKRTFTFTSTSKKTNSESTSTSPQTDGNAPGIELAKQGDDKDVFEFSASDSECSSSKNKNKKAKKRTKRSDSASSSRSTKDNLNKKHRSEKISQQQVEENTNVEVSAPNKKDSSPKISDSTTSKSKRRTLKSSSSDLTDDSFVIGDKVHKENKINELVNSKGDRIFSEFSKTSRRTLSRNCKKLSIENINEKNIPSENISNVECNAYKDVNDPSPSELTSPPIVQDKKKCSSLNKYSPVTDSEVFGKDSCDGLSSKSSKVSEGKRKAKRTFSGVSERRSKKKSTLDPPDFLEEFNSSTILEVDIPKTTQLNSNTLIMDCDATEVYNFKEIIQAKGQEDSSNNQEQTSDVKKIQQNNCLIAKPETCHILKVKDAILDADVLKSKKPMKESNKEKALLVKSNKNEENFKKATLPNSEPLTSAIDKSKKTLTVGKQEQVIEDDKKKHLESVINEVSKSKKSVKDFNKEKALLVKQIENEENSKKAILPNAETLTSPSAIDKSKKTFTLGKQEQVIEGNKVKHVESLVKEVVKNTLPKDVLCNTEVITSSLKSNKYKKPIKDSNPEQLTADAKKHREDPTKKLKTVQVTQSSQKQVAAAMEKHEEDQIKKLKIKQVIQSTSNQEEALVQSMGTNKNSSSHDTVPLFNRADFKTTHLDDLTNNDFVQPKSKKLLAIKKDKQNKEDGAPIKEKRPKSKKPREEKSNSDELKVSASGEAHFDPKSSKDVQNFEEVYPATVSNSIPIHRQNCSGSIDSLSNVDSKDNERRPSRRNRPTKSYKEPSLHVKMRR